MTRSFSQRSFAVRRNQAVALQMSLAVLLNDHGWAIALHGSFKRDLDFIAVPWSDDHPTNLTALVRIIEDEFGWTADGPAWKPHSRLGWMFLDSEPPAIDISFIDPRNAISRAFRRPRP